MGYFIASIIFILAQAFFSGIETGLISMRKSRVRHGVKSGVSGAGILNFFITHPGYMLATTLVGTNICVVCTAKMAKEGTIALGFKGPMAMLSVTIILTALLLAAEIIPKDWFRQHPYHRCLMFSGVLQAAYFILYVPVHLMAGLTQITTRMIKNSSEPKKAEAAMMREDFIMLLRESETAGIIDSEAADILDRSMEFHEITVQDIFQPKQVVVDAPADMTVKEAIRLCGEKGVSRLPVRNPNNDENPNDTWLGVFSLYDMIFAIPEDQWNNSRIGDSMNSIASIPLNATMESVLLLAKESASPLLAVLSETGANETHIGIVSRSDVVKRLFG